MKQLSILHNNRPELQVFATRQFCENFENTREINP